ncbi:MAG: right-handed parallel beta-helix repeat-containing protein, partial [Planctomycetes bacterium]|nr:right-handed parallel beta-helix repeat-containing protein [Planctomycetota bacterium]
MNSMPSSVFVSAMLWMAILAGVLSRDTLARPLYVCPDGNDAWSGALALPNAAKTDGPLATLAGARNTVRKLKAAGGLKEPVRVMIRGGMYELKEPFVLEPQDSGTAECPIVYGALKGEKPMISGGRVIRGWRPGSVSELPNSETLSSLITRWREPRDLWVAEVPEAKGRKWQFRQLFVNGWRCTLARSPNMGYFRIAGKAAPILDPKTGKEADSSKVAFRFKPGDIKRWTNMSDINAFIFFHWETGMLRLKAVDEETSTVTFTGPMKWPFWGRQRYFVENVREALDAPGEWFLDADAGVLHYCPWPGENMHKATVVAPALTQLVRLEGNPDKGEFVEYVGFEGLSFQYADYTLEPEGHCDWQAAVTVPAVIQARGARACFVERCEVAHVGQYAIWFERGCKDNAVVQNHIHDIGAGGVRIGEPGNPPTENAETKRNVVSNNFIHDIGHLFPGAIGVWIGQSSENVVSHNEICDTFYTAISCGWTWGYGRTKARNNLIEWNYLHHIGQGMLCDMGAIYTLGIQPGTQIRFNLIHDVWDWDEGYGAGGIYPDEGSSQILIENNVVFQTASGGLTVHYGKDNIARNNIFALGRDAQVHLGRKDKDSSLKFERNIVYCAEGKLFVRECPLEADNNVYFRTDGEPVTFLSDLSLEQWQAKGLDVHSVVADPKFVDPKRFDFRLRPDSPALQLGFVPFDLSAAGLVGEKEWVELPRRIQRPPTVVTRRPQPQPVTLDDGFETTPVGAAAENATTHGETDKARIRVTDELAAAGKRCLKFTDAPGLDQTWNPHLYYVPHFREGLVAHSFDLRMEKGAVVWIEWRDASHPYRVGPSMGIDAEGRLTASKQQLMSLPIGRWIHFEI